VARSGVSEKQTEGEEKRLEEISGVHMQITKDVSDRLDFG
jgi:hypothetical protein